LSPHSNMPPPPPPKNPPPPSPPENLPPSSNAEPVLSEIEVIRTAQEFIRALQNASLDNGDLDAQSLQDLLNPDQHPLDLDPVRDHDLLMCLKMFIAQQDTYSSDESYTANISAVHNAYPDSKLYSHYRIEKEVKNLSGIQPILCDMCPNSCMAYTGPLKNLEQCTQCGERHYDEKGNYHQKFYTIPIAPQIQARKWNEESAKELDYLHSR
ncbi:hypothetical protein GYMLUDRAFT_119772, partial [Collybiopsis luxurians FD-317 M1]